jgi:hypothetical protein
MEKAVPLGDALPIDREDHGGMQKEKPSFQSIPK